MGRKKTLGELQLAEVRYRNFLERRDRHNADARAIREERDLLNRKKGEVRQEIVSLRSRRSLILSEVREHKASRNELQGRAKELILVKRKLRGDLKGGLEGELMRQQERMREMDTRQQTTSLTLEEEEKLLSDLRQVRDDVARLETIERDHGEVLQQVVEIDGSIDDLFQQAEAQHRLVLRKSEESQSIMEEIAEKEESHSLLTAEANRVHKAFVSVREKADHYHKKAMELREKLISIKRSRREEYEEGRKGMLEQKEAVKRALEDEEAVEKAVEEALSHLLKKGKLEL
ncbi:MAG: hypothetical protein LN412_01905 [Candidatus Thermoplasmatota archaeon]|nr:hypothetical protein [Candidatus Thermoplasmatota archaeon]